MKTHIASAIGSTIRQGSRASSRMKAMTKIATVGMSPISAMEIRNATIQPKNMPPRRSSVLVGKWLTALAISM